MISSLPVSGHFVRGHRKAPNIDNKKEIHGSIIGTRAPETSRTLSRVQYRSSAFTLISEVKKRRLKKGMIKRNRLKQNMDYKVQG